MTQQEYENKIKELQDELEKLKATKIADSGKRWKPELRHSYWAVKVDGQIISYIWRDSTFDDWYYLTGNCFETEKEAREYKSQFYYTARYKNYIKEHSRPLDWDDWEQNKFGAYYDYNDKVISVDKTGMFVEQGKIYASSEQIIWDAIKEIGEDNFKKYVLGVE